MSFKLKLSKDGNTKEFQSNSFGPIFLGLDDSGEYCFNNINANNILEIKLSQGETFIKCIHPVHEVYLNSVSIGQNDFINYYKNGCITFAGHNIQIYLENLHEVDKTPPPFFEDEFQERLIRMDKNIAEKEKAIKELDQTRDKKQAQLSELENKVQKHLLEKNKLDIELSSLIIQKNNLNKEILGQTKATKDEEDKIKRLQKTLTQLQYEERNLKEKIDANNIALEKLKYDKEFKSQEVEDQRILSAELSSEVIKLKDTLNNLTNIITNQENEIKKEDQKYKNILIQTNLAHKEEHRIKTEIYKIQREKSALNQEQAILSGEVVSLNDQKKLALNKLGEINAHIEFENDKIKRIQTEILRHHENEKNLSYNCKELEDELARVQEKLTSKKNSYNQAEFDHQELLRKISAINFQLEQTQTRLGEYQKEEKVQELKVVALREELQNKTRTVENEKATLTKDFEDFNYQIENKKKALNLELNQLSASKENLINQKDEVLSKIEIYESQMKELHKDANRLQLNIDDLKNEKDNLLSQIAKLSNETFELEKEKNLYNTQINHFKSQMQVIQDQINEAKSNSALEIEQYKREERLKIISEKGVALAEIENERQKSLIEIHNEFKIKADEASKMQEIASEQASQIIAQARLQEINITKEAQTRLQSITKELTLREEETHTRVKQASDFVKQKEIESEEILKQARHKASDLIQEAKANFEVEYTQRRQKVKDYLSHKREQGLCHLKELEDLHIQKLEKSQNYQIEKIELLKRKELKKVAKVIDERINSELEQKEAWKQEFNAMKEKGLLELEEIRQKQLEELAQKKKATIDHINSLKMDAKRNLEEELSNERSLMSKYKKERIQNATQAVVNILKIENTLLDQDEEKIRNKILSALERSIDGQNAQALKNVDHIFDLNPAKKKHFFPVIKKYTLKIGIPAAIAIVLLADIGNVRTFASNHIQDYLKSSNSASQIYVEKQQEDWKQKHTFNPDQTAGYKATLTENVIYTKDFIKTVEDENFQNNWMLKVHDFLVKDLELSEDLAINYISSEGALIKELAEAKKDLHPQLLDQGIEKMKNLEREQLGWLNEKIPSPQDLEKFNQFRKEFFDNYYSSANRAPASANEATSISE